jgi:hypothetical protein
MNKEKYECPRCGYTTKTKQNIWKHLYTLKKTCQGIKNTLELNDEIKEYILNNRKYQTTPNISNHMTNIYQNITTYNQINNVICKMDVLEKLTKYILHCGESLLDFDDHVSQTYQGAIERLDKDSFKDFSMNPKTFLEIIDTLTTCESIEKLNVLYDEQSQRIQLVEFGRWRSKILESGIDEILLKIQSGYLDYYEEYLLRKCKGANTYTMQVIKERLQDYYKFLVCFNLDPCVKDIKYIGDDKTDMIYKMYKELKNELKKTEETKTRRAVTCIIRRNCKANIIELNKKIMDLIQVDENFKNHVLDQFSRYSNLTTRNCDEIDCNISD